MVLWVHFFGVILKYPYHIVPLALGKCHNATAARAILLTGERPQRPQSCGPFIRRVSQNFSPSQPLKTARVRFLKKILEKSFSTQNLQKLPRHLALISYSELSNCRGGWYKRGSLRVSKN